MYKIITATVLAVFSFNANSADFQAGKAKSTVCAACHGVDGNSALSSFPKLAGQNITYLKKQIQNFKSGARKDPIMSGQAAVLSDSDTDNLALYFATQDTKIGETPKNLVELGQAIYRGGDTKSQISSCAACHSPNGSGNKFSKYPKLSGQHAGYIESQLKKFRDGSRNNDINHIMRDIAKRMNDEQIKAVSAYIEGLH